MGIAGEKDRHGGGLEGWLGRRWTVPGGDGARGPGGPAAVGAGGGYMARYDWCGRRRRMRQAAGGGGG